MAEEYIHVRRIKGEKEGREEGSERSVDGR